MTPRWSFATISGPIADARTRIVAPMVKPSRQYAYDTRRRAAGWRRVPVWLSPDLKAALDAHRAAEGLSEQEAIRAMLVGALSKPERTPTDVVFDLAGRLGLGD